MPVPWSIHICQNIQHVSSYETTNLPSVLLSSVLWCCWLGGRKGIRPVKKQIDGVLVWLSIWSKVQTCIWPSWCHCYSLSLASVKSRLVLPFWYWLICVVPEKGPLNGCVCMCVSRMKDFSLVGYCSIKLVGYLHTENYEPSVSHRILNI